MADKGPVKKSTDPNPLKDFFADDMKDPKATLPAKLKAIEGVSQVETQEITFVKM